MSPDVEAAIRKAAEEEGVDPSEALSYADRESSGNTAARSSSSMKGLYQMSGRLRSVFGDADDAYGQTKAWIRAQAANKAEMAGVLGRDPTSSEAYLGHHFGGVRGARVIGMDPNTPVDQVFTPMELAQNPHIVRAGNVGTLRSSLISDMDTRQAKFGGNTLDFSPLVSGKASSVTAPSQSEAMDFTPQVSPQDFSAQVAQQ